jgi:hypothetical protein
LHDIERGLVVADREQGLLVRATLDSSKEARKLGARGQGDVLERSVGLGAGKGGRC